jgi:hypothetical protein
MVTIATTTLRPASGLAAAVQTEAPADPITDGANKSSSAPASNVDAVSNFVAMYGLHSVTNSPGASPAKQVPPANNANTVLQAAHEQKKQTEQLAAQAQQSGSSAKGGFLGSVNAFFINMVGGSSDAGDSSDAA